MQQPKLTLSRETLATLDQAPAENQDQRDRVRYPTTTVLTRFISCTSC